MYDLVTILEFNLVASVAKATMEVSLAKIAEALAAADEAVEAAAIATEVEMSRLSMNTRGWKYQKMFRMM